MDPVHGLIAPGIPIMQQYHLRRAEKAITDSAGILSLLQEGRWLVLGLCAEEIPYVVSLNYGHDPERNCLYMHCATEGRKMEIIRKNSSCCATIVEDHGYKTSDCDHAYRSLVLFGTISIVESQEEKLHALETLIRHLEPDPDPVRRRFIREQTDLDTVGIMRMDIQCITGKINR